MLNDKIRDYFPPVIIIPVINLATAHSKDADLDLGPFVVSSFLLSHYKGEQCLSVKPKRLKMHLCFFPQL